VLRASAALLSVSCFASLARAQERELDPTWTDTSELSDEEGARCLVPIILRAVTNEHGSVYTLARV
jgi:hypothetical protein